MATKTSEIYGKISTSDLDAAAPEPLRLQDRQHGLKVPRAKMSGMSRRTNPQPQLQTSGLQVTEHDRANTGL